MNERTNKEIEGYLKNNRYVKYDEIDKIMYTVDGLTEFQKKSDNKYENRPVLKEMMSKTFNIPLWVILGLCGLSFWLGTLA